MIYKHCKHVRITQRQALQVQISVLGVTEQTCISYAQVGQEGVTFPVRKDRQKARRNFSAPAFGGSHPSTDKNTPGREALTF